MLRRCFAWLAPVGALVLGGAIAAAPRGEQRQETQQPQCRSLSIRGSSRLDAALQALVRADEASAPEVRRRFLGDAVRALGEAVRDGRGDPLTIWHFFGQAYALQGDLAGADSAFRRAEALADSECVVEIAQRRRARWAPFVREGGAQSQAGNVDSALALFRLANTIYRGAPFAFISMGNIFLNRTQTDSAIVYFRLAGRASDEADYFPYRWRALLNVAHLLVRENRLSEADSAFREYLRLRPYDLSAQASLAGVLQQSNRPAEAQAVYDSLFVGADSASSFELFDTGVVLFQQERFPQAARAFELGLATNPSHRDGLFNLANSYIAANDSARILPAAQRLVALDSMNRQSLQLLAAGYMARGDANSTVEVLLRRDSLPFEVSIVRFEPADTTASVRGTVENLQPRILPAFQLTLEFVNSANEVVARESVAIPQLGPAGNTGNTHEFSLRTTGRSIVAYRYLTR